MNGLERCSRVARVPLLALLAFAALASPAIAQKADRPIVRAGDRWQFVEYYGIASTDPNRDWVVTSVTRALLEGAENGEMLMVRTIGARHREVHIPQPLHRRGYRGTGQVPSSTLSTT